MKQWREDDRVVPFECAIHLPLSAPRNVSAEDYDQEWLMRMLMSHRVPDTEGLVKVPDSTEITSIRIESDSDSRLRVAYVRATAVYRKPRHLPIIDDWIDLYAFKFGASFRTADGQMVVTDEDGPVLLPRSPFGEPQLPFTLLWEPDQGMTSAQTLRADYHRVTGVPKRLMVQLEDNLHDALLEGAL